MSETTKQRVEAEAEDFASRHYEDLHSHRAGAEVGFIAGRTVSREAYVQAARRTGISTYQAREYLREAGLLIEGES